ncbi:cortexin domain containing 2 [Peromyscus maniculatus bairdii]|uniref:cortexin domain containing 2 n=1 Tax=Peromyscus maniculatus bairdii TaxID=230844 RepID=UPI003FD202A9
MPPDLSTLFNQGSVKYEVHIYLVSTHEFGKRALKVEATGVIVPAAMVLTLEVCVLMEDSSLPSGFDLNKGLTLASVTFILLFLIVMIFRWLKFLRNPNEVFD